MPWLTIVLAAVLSLAALLYVIEPLRRPARALPRADEDELTALIARKDSVLRAIKEVEFDRRTGKLSEEDFQRYDQRLRHQAVGLLQQLEKQSPAVNARDDELEEEIARLRKTSGTPRKVRPVASPPAAAGRFCHECGTAAAASDRFCAKCGTQLRRESGW